VKVLVTGATGFVGSHVVDEMLRRGHEVAYVARATSNHRWLENKPVELREGSLYDPESLHRAVHGIDVVVHVAGQISGRNEEDFYRGNVTVTRNVLDAIRAYRPGLSRYVHVSSASVTGPSANAAEPVTEDSPLKPITAYGRTKLQAEQAVLEVAAEFPCTITRPCVVYGPRDEATLTFFQLVNRGFAPLIGFDEKFVSMIHARDLARGIADAALNPAAIGQTYFITGEEIHTWQQIANIAAAVSGRRRLANIRLPHPLVLAIAGTVGGFGRFARKPPVIDYDKGRDFVQKFWTSSGAKARKELGFRPEISLNDGILETVNWYKEMKWL
jgi:nucleoside-diphosphate-sugar epimerase